MREVTGSYLNERSALLPAGPPFPTHLSLATFGDLRDNMGMTPNLTAPLLAGVRKARIRQLESRVKTQFKDFLLRECKDATDLDGSFVNA
jgi:hypothetical protein